MNICLQNIVKGTRENIWDYWQMKTSQLKEEESVKSHSCKHHLPFPHWNFNWIGEVGPGKILKHFYGMFHPFTIPLKIVGIWALKFLFAALVKGNSKVFGFSQQLCEVRGLHILQPLGQTRSHLSLLKPAVFNPWVPEVINILLLLTTSIQYQANR